MTPEFSNTSTNPGSGNTITWQSGHLTLSEIGSLKEFWPDILSTITKISIQDWAPIRQIIETWAYPGRIARVLPEVHDDMQIYAGEMISDILPIISEHAGLLHWANHLAREANLSVSVPVDLTFEILYPNVDLVDFHADSNKQLEAVKQLALTWKTRTPKEVMKGLFRIEKEAQLAGHAWPRLTPFFCLELSKLIDKEYIWIDEGIKEGVTGDLVFPFLKRVIENRSRGWIGKFQKWLKESILRPYIMQLVITAPKMPKKLLDEIYSNLDNIGGWIEILCLRGEIPESRVLRLLKHEKSDIALAAAKGEWMMDPVKGVRKSLEKQWKYVIVNFLQEDYLLEDIFNQRPTLASAWLSARIQEAVKSKDRFIGFRLERAFGIAAKSLKLEERQSLLRTISPFPYDNLIVTPLIGDNIELYKELLANKNMKHSHLDPLFGKPTDSWAAKATAAIDSGYSVKEVAHATRWANMRVVTESGNESDRWTNWIECFEPYLQHNEEKIREVAKTSIANAKDARDRALREEQQEAVFGRRY
jgi:hypothetical protein